MLFNSYIFILFFLPVTIGGYFFLNKRSSKGGLVWLSLLSVFFYAYAKPVYLIWLLISIGINYGLSLLLLGQKRDGRKKILLGTGIGFHLLCLFYFKYMNFFLNIVDELGVNTYAVQIAAPLGISFITFSQISYLVDTFRSQDRKKTDFLEYFLYVTFFPKITMGPILVAEDFLPYLKNGEGKKPSYENLSKGLYLFSMGLGKKVLIADTLAGIVSIGFSGVQDLNSLTALVTMVGYTLQLYFDFSGYCDMASGIASMLNLPMALNFNSPYKARSITEFWERWHITLTRFFTRYLYIPLGGNRKGLLRTYSNILLVFFISGLWHGDNWTFILWGLLHGICMVVERFYRNLRGERKNTDTFLKKIVDVISWAGTFTIVNFAWVLFRSESVEEARLFFKALFSGGWVLKQKIVDYFLGLIEIRILGRLGLSAFLEEYAVICILLSFMILILVCIFKKNVVEKCDKGVFNIKRGIWVSLLMLWCIISLSNITEFLYFEF